MLLLLVFMAFSVATPPGRADPIAGDDLARFVQPPFLLGAPVNDKGVWEVLNSAEKLAGYAFETQPLAPLPGFSGAPINVFVMLDLEGRFLDVRLISHNEPIFVSGLGETPFREFFEQYAGHSIAETLVVGTPYGDAAAGSSLVYLDGVTKATASVRIAHESLLAATRAVAREKMQGVASGPPARPDPDHEEVLSWTDLVEQGLASRHRVSNAEIDAAFAGTIWAQDDPGASADPDGAYLDLWVIDVGPPAIARAALSEKSFDELQQFLSISTEDEPILLIEAGRHGLVSPDFVRNTSPDWLSAKQDGLPVSLRDADLLVETAAGAPEGVAMILRTDRRLGFDPTRLWELKVQAVREHGVFQPEIGSVTLTAAHRTPERFYLRPDAVRTLAHWQQALRSRQADLAVLAIGLVALMALLGPAMHWLAGKSRFTAIRLGILAVVIGFVGWWGQGQLSIVTVLGVVRTAIDGGSFAFLVYDPFSLMIWGASILGFFLWGRGLFCGWLCPFGAMQEFAAHAGRILKLPRLAPSATWHARLVWLKYAVLAALIVVAIGLPEHIDTAAEVEPFKTAVTTVFQREWYFVAYAAGLLLFSAVLYKGFCRYICPLGAAMAVGGLLRRRDWIDRRKECGTPCQLCRVRCNYNAIAPSGRIEYSECFQCLDCVAIHDDPSQCVPLVLADRARSSRRQSKGVAAE